MSIDWIKVISISITPLLGVLVFIIKLWNKVELLSIEIQNNKESDKEDRNINRREIEVLKASIKESKDSTDKFREQILNELKVIENKNEKNKDALYSKFGNVASNVARLDVKIDMFLNRLDKLE